MPPIKNKKTDRERFYEKVNIDPSGCWLWKAGMTYGYGAFHYKGRVMGAHRVAYLWAYGELPEALVIDHLCGNAPCVNARHLQAVTLAENTRRAAVKPRRAPLKPFCKFGHSLTEENLRAPGAGRCWVCRRDTARRWAAKNRLAARENRSF